MSKIMNANDLMSTLSDTIREVKAGKMEAKTANVIIGASGKILSVAKLQMQYTKLTGKDQKIKLLAE